MRLPLIIIIIFIHLILASGQELILQPSFETGNDSYIFSAGLTSNYGYKKSVFCYTWTQGGNKTNVRGLIKFDLNQLPENVTIDNASLSLYWNPTDTKNGVNVHSGQNDFWLERIIHPWHENKVNWTNQPQTTLQNRVYVAESNSGDENYIDLDVTDLVIDMVENPNEGYGFLLKMDDENNPYKNVVFASSENDNEEIKPMLKIDYTIDNENCMKIRPNQDEGKDSYIWSAGISNNYGDEQSIHAYTWTHNGNGAIVRGLVDFDLNDIPNGSEIESAKLSFFYNPNTITNDVDIHSGQNDLIIERITSPWEESAINWSNQPPTTEMNKVEIGASEFDNQDYLDIDITDLLKDAIDIPSESYGFMLKMKNETVPYRNLIFASSDHPNSSLHPLMEVCWSLPTSIQAADSKNDIRISPNPSSAFIRIEGLTNDITNITIRNAGGVIKYSTDLSGKQQLIIDIQSLSKGIYFVEFNSELSKKKVVKFIKI